MAQTRDGPFACFAMSTRNGTFGATKKCTTGVTSSHVPAGDCEGVYRYLVQSLKRSGKEGGEVCVTTLRERGGSQGLGRDDVASTLGLKVLCRRNYSMDVATDKAAT